MKKILFSLASASLLLIAAGCNQKDDMLIEFPAPITKDVAVNIDFDKGEILHLELPNRGLSGSAESIKSGETAKLDISSIELTEGGRYLLYIDGKNTKAPTKKFLTVWTGRVIYNTPTKEYNLSGVGKIKITDKGCLITPNAVKSDDNSFEIPATITYLKTKSIGAGNLARSWTIKSCYVTINGGKNNVSISKGFNGCDLKEIATYCKSKGIGLTEANLQELDGYKMEEIVMTGSNSFIMTFDNAEPFYGTYALNGSSYSWTLNTSIQFIPAQAQGTVSFPSMGTSEIEVNASVTGGGETYNGTILFTIGAAD